MKTIERTLILIIISLVVNKCSSAQENRNNSTELFVQFKELFHEIELPIVWNRQDIGRLTMPSWKPKGIYNEIPDDFFSFIPEDILGYDSTTYIRALFQLPPKNDIHLFIIATDYMYDRFRSGVLYNIITKLYLTGYDNSGKLLFYKLISGRYVDKWDRLLTFNLDYKFETRHYEFLGGTIKHPSKKHRHIELIRCTKEICEISVSGIINCTSTTIKGYFDSTTNGDYELVKIYEDN